jgi:DNA repair exonuclease SbcCD nuclease subunit
LKLALFSDLHVHAYREFSEPLPSGLNSRLGDTLDALEAVVRGAEGLDALVFGGDLFHKRRILDVRAFNEVFDRLAINKVSAYLLRGNHDQATRDGKVHSLHSLKKVASIIDRPKLVELDDGIWINFIPWSDNPAETKAALKTKRPKGATSYICVGHFGVLGAVTGPTEYVPLEPIQLEDLPDGLYDFGFLGHYHRRQKLKERWWYIGSPLQTSRGERGENKGYLIYDTDNPNKFTVKPLHLPEFVLLEAKDIEAGGIKEKVRGNFVDVMLDEEPSGGVEGFKALLLKLGARGANVVCVPKEKAGVARLDVHPGLAPVEMVELYVEKYAGDGLSHDRIIELAKNALERAES